MFPRIKANPDMLVCLVEGKCTQTSQPKVVELNLHLVIVQFASKSTSSLEDDE